ncbi:MAG: hypothetical protein OEW62_01290 [Candidatus Bathyarchaeota archaeon]|nr:hypothetical protein [Candidatus Bathyarchaeota archaeon]
MSEYEKVNLLPIVVFTAETALATNERLLFQLDFSILRMFFDMVEGLWIW